MNSISHDEQLLKSLTLAVANRPRATMKELAQQAGVSKATLHRYCGTRENLTAKLEEHAEGTLKLIIDNAGLQHLEPLEALRRLIREHLAHRELLAFLMAQYRPDFLDLEQGGDLHRVVHIAGLRTGGCRTARARGPCGFGADA
jgi:TetR/AcrR family transcriptional repressor of mexCD-oprJ operon